MFLLLALALDAGSISDAGPRLAASVDASSADAGSSQDYGLQVSVEASNAQPGDPIWLVLKLRYDKSLSVDVPEVLPDGRGMAPLGPPERSPKDDGDALLETLRFPFVLLALTDVRTPKFTLRVGDDELAIPSLPLMVPDAGPSSEAPDPDLEGMVVYRSGPAPWVIPTLALVLGLIALVLALRFWWSKRSVIVDEPEAVIDAGGEFMTLVARLRAQLSDDPEIVRGCWFDLLTGLRVYLDRRFGLQSAQSTTEEMLSALASTRIVGIPRVGLSQLLERADEVRYAAAESSREAMADLLDQVEVWVGTAEQAKTQEDR
jgi:hypothetical protein